MTFSRNSRIPLGRFPLRRILDQHANQETRHRRIAGQGPHHRGASWAPTTSSSRPIGHIRDLPEQGSEVRRQPKVRGAEPIGVDIDDGFAPLYVVTPDSKKQVAKLRKLSEDVDELYLATDEDREGEAIAWHLLEVLKPKVPVRRMVFHEITPEAIERSGRESAELDGGLVAAQEARRVLDRLFGYEVSAVLWRKVSAACRRAASRARRSGSSSSASRRACAFVALSYCGVKGRFASRDGRRLQGDAERRRFDVGWPPGRTSTRDGSLKRKADVVQLDGERRRGPRRGSSGRRPSRVTLGRVASPYTGTAGGRRSAPPRCSRRRAASCASRLSGGRWRPRSGCTKRGYITYMRTDSTTLSEPPWRGARATRLRPTAPSSCPAKPRAYGKQARNAQEAHEAIRPAGEQFHEPEMPQASFGPSRTRLRLYDLIWKRTVASQMKDAQGESLRCGSEAWLRVGRECEFQASGRTITFPGFMRAYVEGSDDPEAALEDRETHLPDVAEGEALQVLEMQASSHETKPPPGITEASWSSELEELGIGRPSTYASIISTILDREYAGKQGPRWCRPCGRSRSFGFSKSLLRLCELRLHCPHGRGSRRNRRGQRRARALARRVLLR